MAHQPRQFRNRLPDYPEPIELQAPSHDPIAAAASTIPREALLSLFHETLEAVQGYSTHSPTIYTGAAGVAYALWHSQRSLRRGCHPPLHLHLTPQPNPQQQQQQLHAPAGPADSPPPQPHQPTSAAADVSPDDKPDLLAALLAAAVERCRTAVAALKGPKGLGLTHGSRAASMLDGAAGVHLTAALVLHDAAAAAAGGGGGGVAADSTAAATVALRRERDDHVASYLELYPVAMDSENDEYLYGRAGYLQGAQLLNAVIGPGTVAEEVVEGVAEEIWESGRELAARLRWRRSDCPPPPLFFVWPDRERGEPYLGAAHGMMGILFSLLHVPSLVQQHAQELRACLDYVASHETDAAGCTCRGGHYPTRMSVEPPAAEVTHGSPKVLVHWCHGATGAVFMWVKAFEVFRSPAYLCAAQRAGEVVWQLGLLRKGHGLCHGTSGNAYALMALHRALRAAAESQVQQPPSQPSQPQSSPQPPTPSWEAARWLHRARCFAAHMASGEGRSVYDTPDRPLSLYEGRAGALCLLADLLADDGGALGARFPAFELLPP